MIFDPYSQWLQIPADRRPPNYYDLLGLPALEQDVGLIRERALERTALVRRYQLGDKSALVHQLLGELSQAFACLSDPQRKSVYDDQLRDLATVASQDVVQTQVDVPQKTPLPSLVVGPIVRDSEARPATVDLRGTPAHLRRQRRRQPNLVVWALGIAVPCLGGLAWLASGPAESPPPPGTNLAIRRPRESADLPAAPGNVPKPGTAGYTRQQFISALSTRGLDPQYMERVATSIPGANSQLYRISRDCLQIIECRSPEEAARSADEIRQALNQAAAAGTDATNARPPNVLSPTLGSAVVLYHKGQLIVASSGQDAVLRSKLSECLGRPIAEAALRWTVDTGLGLLGQFLSTPKQMGRAGSEIRTGILNQRTGTLAAWIKPERSPPVRFLEGVIDADRPIEAGSGWGLCNGSIKVILDDEFWDTGIRVRLHEWQHVALTFDSTEARLFVDGRLAAIHNYRQGRVSVQRYVIGCSAANPLRFQGLMQDARIYDRVLAPQVIQALAVSPPH